WGKFFEGRGRSSEINDLEIWREVSEPRRNFIRCKTQQAGSASRISGTRGLKGSPTGCLVFWRLCGGRHNITDRGRRALRGSRHSVRPKSARRGGRQWDGQPGCRKALVRCHVNGLCSKPARAWSRPRSGRRLVY